MKLCVLVPLLLSYFACPCDGGEEAAGLVPEVAGIGDGQEREGASADLRAAIEKLDIPGVKIDLEERSVDIDAVVCLREGLLELVACTEDSKEHESIVAVRARPSHIHTALLLMGGRAGNPAMRRALDGQAGRFVDVPPRGGEVDVSLVIEDQAGESKEHPISDFIVGSGVGGGGGFGGVDGDVPGEGEAFPTDTFVFAGSILEEGGEGAARYLSDLSGNVISLATFGDEVLCLPGVYDQADGALHWQVDGEKLPAPGTEVILRLRVRVAGEGDGR